MSLLLDTNVFLWYITADARLSRPLVRLIEDEEGEVFLSVISLWEIVVKNALGKLPLPGPPDELIPAQRDKHGLVELPIEGTAVAYLPKLPDVHRDPFDRMLVCQALDRDLRLVTSDRALQRYPIKFIAA